MMRLATPRCLGVTIVVGRDGGREPFSLRRACTAAAGTRPGGSMRIHADAVFTTNLHGVMYCFSCLLFVFSSHVSLGLCVGPGRRRDQRPAVFRPGLLRTSLGAAVAGAGPGCHACRRRRGHCQGHHRVRAAPPPRPVPIGAHPAAVGGGATPAGHRRTAAPAIGVAVTAGGGRHARHCHYARGGPVRLPRGAGLHDARDGRDAAGGGKRQTAVRHWTPTAAAEGSLLFVRGWARRSGALVIPL